MCIRDSFVISTSVIDCLGRFVPEMTYYVSSGTLNLTKLKLKLVVFWMLLCSILNPKCKTLWLLVRVLVNFDEEADNKM